MSKTDNRKQPRVQREKEPCEFGGESVCVEYNNKDQAQMIRKEGKDIKTGRVGSDI